MSVLEQVYARSPAWLQTCGVTLYGFAWQRRRFGAAFKDALPQFTARESLSEIEWRRYQQARLTELLLSCYERVSYYSRSWSEAGFTRDQLAKVTPQTLRDLPLVGKQDLRREPDSFIARRTFPRRLHTYHTSGSTGTPVAVRMSTATHQHWSAAYEARCRRWAGVNYRMRRAMIGGRLVVARANSSPPYWRYNRAERQLYLSAFHISPQTVHDYVAALNAHQPEYLVGYASAHYFLAQFIAETGLRVHTPRAVLTSSEVLTAGMRQVIGEVYRCEVFDAYSGVEPCCLISECEFHRLHVSPDVGIVELIAANGQPAAAGEEGEVVATGFLNADQPLVRYRLGDLAAWDDRACPCGRQMPVIRAIYGRVEDAVIAPDGRQIVRFHGLMVGISAIEESQVVQETLHDYTVRVVTKSGLTAQERQTLAQRMRDRMGNVNVKIEEVARIERTERGKFRAVVSHVTRKSDASSDARPRS